MTDDADEDGGPGSCTEVTMTWGTLYVRWMTVTASTKFSAEVIFIPESNLGLTC